MTLATSDLLPVAIAFLKATAVLAGVGSLLAAGCSAVIYSFDEAGGFPWRDAAVELRPLPGLKEIRLGETLQEASRVGVFEPDESAPSRDDSAASSYRQRGGQIRLRVVNERVTRISYECRDADGTRVNRVQCDDPPGRVFEVFGNGARRLCAKVTAADPAAKVAPEAYALDVLDTGTRYVAIQGRVRGFIVMEPRELEEAMGGDLPWQRCG